MDARRIVSELRAERDRLDQAIAALEALEGGGAGKPVTGRGRPRGGARRISAAGRKRIAEAARRMWAERNRKTAKAPGGRSRHMSPAARRRLSQIAKARWAKRKKEGKTSL